MVEKLTLRSGRGTVAGNKSRGPWFLAELFFEAAVFTQYFYRHLRYAAARGGQHGLAYPGAGQHY